MASTDPQPKVSSPIEYYILVIVGAVGIILMLVAADLKDFWSKVLSDLGGALVIAALVGGFVERRLVKHATEEMVAAGTNAAKEMVSVGVATTKQMVAAGTHALKDMRDIIAGGLREYIPQEKVDALQKSILHPTFLRQRMIVVVHLSPAATAGRLKGTVSLRYGVRNLTAETQDYFVRMNLDEKYGDGSANLDSAKINGQVIDLLHPPKGTTLLRNANTLMFQHPVQIASKNKVEVDLKGYQMMAEEDVWPWNLLGISDSVEITVTYPPELLKVWLLPNHPFKTQTDFGVIDNLGSIKAAIDDVIVSYQGFEIKWEPLHSPPAAEPARPVVAPGPSADGKAMETS